MNSSAKTFFIRLGVALGILVAVLGGYYLLRYQAWAAYRNWSVARMNHLAKDFLAAGDSRNALLTVRKVLSKRPNDVEAWRLGVEAARRNDTPEVVQFQRNLRRVDPTPANQLELIRLALQYRVYSLALQAVDNVSKETGDLPDFHRLAAETYRLTGRPADAREHLVRLVAQVPDDAPAQLGLAEIEFETNAGAVPGDWPARVARLAGRPETELPAMLLQLRMAVLRRDVAAATPLLAKVQGRTDLEVAQRLQVLDAVSLVTPAETEKFLADIQRQAAAQPADIARVMAWLAAASRQAAIVAWYAELPEEARKDDIVKLDVARALESQRDWAALEKLLRGARWKAGETQRLALLARAYRMMGRQADFAESWKLALIAVGQDVRAGARLLETVSAWDWPEERRDVLWKIFNLIPTNKPLREQLITHEFLAGNTANLNRIYARIIEAAPEDDEARNNFAYTSLLLDTNLGRAQTIARDLHRKYPDNVAYLTTYTLALHKDGRAAQALEVLAALPTKQVSRSIVLHEVIYASASGKIEQAAALLPQLDRARMLPEEDKLLSGARLAVAQAGLRADRQQALAGLATLPASTPGGWLAWLPEIARNAPDEIRLADSYYRDGNFAALVELTQKASWKENDHLRQALLAYARRQLAGENASRDVWRQAVATAGRDARRLRDLDELAAHWTWEGERMEVVARRFEREASNQALLTELLAFYRRQNRTADLARTLWLYVNETKSTGTEAAWCVYYSLLCDMNVNSAQTLALRVYNAAPQDAGGRVAYAFALWRQRRAEEAWQILQNLNAVNLPQMQVSLVQAGVLLDLNRKQEAQDSLARFVAINAMPEEKNLADTLSRKVGLLSTSTLTLTSNASSK